MTNVGHYDNTCECRFRATFFTLQTACAHARRPPNNSFTPNSETAIAEMTGVVAPKFQEPGRERAFAQQFVTHRKLGCFKCIWACVQMGWRQTTPTHRILCPRAWMEVLPVDAKHWCLCCWVCRQSTIANHDDMEAQSWSDVASCKVRHPRKSHIANHQKSARHK